MASTVTTLHARASKIVQNLQVHMDRMRPSFALDNAQVVHTLKTTPGFALFHAEVTLLEMMRQKNVSESVRHLLTQISA